MYFSKELLLTVRWMFYISYGDEFVASNEIYNDRVYYYTKIPSAKITEIRDWFKCLIIESHKAPWREI